MTPLADFLKHKSHRVTELSGLRSLDQDIPKLTSSNSILVPLQPQGDKSGMAVCLTLRSCPELSEIPIIALSPKKDRAVIESLYGSGADCVHTYEEGERGIEFDLLLMQLMALNRRRLPARPELRTQSLISPPANHHLVFDALEDRVILLDKDGNILNANNSALSLLENHSEMLSRHLSLILRSLLKKPSNFPHREYIGLRTPSGSIENFALEAMTIQSLAVVDRPIFLFALRKIPARLTGGWVYGQNEMERTRKGFLLSLCRRLELNHPNKLTTGLSRATDLNECLTLLLDEYDNITPTTISFKIMPQDNVTIAMEKRDAILFLGLLLFFGIDAVSPTGHISISFNKETSKKAQLTLKLESRQLFPNLLSGPADHIIRQEKQEGSTPEPSDYEIESIKLKLTELAKFAAENGISLNYKSTSNLEFKIRALIPLSQETHTTP